MSGEMPYETIICDLDGTLARSKAPLESAMAETIAQLLAKGLHFVVITGGKEEQIHTQVVGQLAWGTPLERLYLLPTSGSRMKRYAEGEWQEVYAYDLSREEKELIDEVVQGVLARGLVEITDHPWGPIKEDRLSQMTYSLLGQEAPVEEKERWDPDKEKRRLLVAHIQPQLPGFRVAYGGSTTIDITQQGIDKGFGIEEFFKETRLDLERALFVGDAMTPDGNDYPAVRTGIETYTTTGPTETLDLLRRQV